MKRILGMRRPLAVALTLSLALACGVHAKDDASALAIQLPAKDLDQQFLPAIQPMNPDATVNVVIGAAGLAGTPPACDKDFCVGKVPRSIVAKEKGGHGGALQAMVLGAPKAAGTTARGRPLAMLVQKAGEKRQTLLIVTTLASPFGQAQSLEEIEAQSPGLLARLKAALAPAMAGAASGAEIVGRKETIRFLGDAISDFEYAYVKESDKRPLDANGNPQLYSWPGARNIGE